MKAKIENLTNGPRELRGIDGPVIVGPMETVTDKFDPVWLKTAGQAQYFRITPIDPLDHDGDGKKGGAVSSDDGSDDAQEPKRRGRPPKDRS